MNATQSNVSRNITRMYHWIEYNMCDHERLPEELWGTRKETSEYVQHFFWKFKTCTVPRTKRRQTPYKPPFFSIDWRKIENAKFAQVWAINDKYDLYSWRQGVRTYTTAEPTHEPHPHFGSINGEHIEIVPVNMNTFLRPLLLRRSEFWGRTDRTEDEQTVRSIQDQCMQTMTCAGTKRIPVGGCIKLKWTRGREPNQLKLPTYKHYRLPATHTFTY